jgi:hypothetical protein
MTEVTEAAETETSPVERWSRDVDLSRCEYTSEKGRQCKLVVHSDDAKHVFMFRSQVAPPKHITEVVPEGFTLTMERIPRDADLSIQRARTVEPRDEHQVRVDKDAIRAYTAWEKAGSPVGDFADLAPKYGGRYVIPPVAFDTVIAMLNRAKNAGGPLQGKRLQYRRGVHESGNTLVNFLFTDPAPTGTSGE